jgi:phosphate butyryltransferase
VKLVHDGDADMYMKGLLPTGTFLKSVLNKEVGLRTGKPLSHVCVFEIPGIDRLLFLTDVAFMPYPTLEDKKCIIEYTVDVAKKCGVDMPKVAPLAALETVNEKMPVTVEAAELTRMNEAGEITGCIVDGPLSLDIALYKEAAEEKGALDRKVAGDADILLFPDIHAGNLVYKAIVHMVPCKNGNILTGTKAPVILTSRSDTVDVKVNSIALAALASETF